MKNLFLFTVAIALIASACNTTGTSGTGQSENTLIAEMVSEPMGYEGKQVTFEGTITHICRHSGDKMRVNQSDDQDYSIMVMLNDFQAQFGPEFEGKNIKVNGVLKTEMLEAAAGHTHDHDHDHAHEGEHECESTTEASQKLADKGIDPQIFAFVEMTSFEIVEEQQ